jgi:hypothetical protein
MKKSIVWLASYPKSGNTWTRIFLANYFANEINPLPINDADRFGTTDAQMQLYRRAAGGPFDANDKRLLPVLRGRFLSGIASNGADFNFIKTHNVNGAAYGAELIPPQVTRAAVYLVRNPLDVALSFARHFGCTADDAVGRMARGDYVIKRTEQLMTQYLGSWSDHVASWTKPAPFPVIAMRYEDMLHKPKETFSTMLAALGLPLDEGRLDKAVRFSSFDELSRQERETGFKETSPHSESFFTKGQSGQWENDLAPELADRIRKDHKKMMKKFNYFR